MNGTTASDCLCYSCKLYDKGAGCTALIITDFGGKPCPFYKSNEVKEIFYGSVCRACFAQTVGGKCRALDKRPRDGCCAFFKTADRYKRELDASDKRLKELEKIMPGRFTKYYALKMRLRDETKTESSE